MDLCQRACFDWLRCARTTHPVHIQQLFCWTDTKRQQRLASARFHTQIYVCTHLHAQPCLSPGGKVLMMVHVQPEPASAFESLTSLRFATKVGGTELGQASKRAVMAGAPLAQPNPPQAAPAPAAAAAAGGGQGAEAG
eukprot:1150796-Pelagomonas_calceolata.AAC.19